MDGPGTRGAGSFMDRPVGAGATGGGFSFATAGWYRQTRGHALLDIDLYGDQHGGIRVVGVYSGLAGAGKMVYVDPAGRYEYTDVLFADLYSLLYFQDVARGLEAAAGFANRGCRVVEVGCIFTIDRCFDGLAREAEIQVVGLMKSCTQVQRHQVPKDMESDNNLYV